VALLGQEEEEGEEGEVLRASPRLDVRSETRSATSMKRNQKKKNDKPHHHSSPH